MRTTMQLWLQDDEPAPTVMSFESSTRGELLSLDFEWCPGHEMVIVGTPAQIERWLAGAHAAVTFATSGRVFSPRQGELLLVKDVRPGHWVQFFPGEWFYEVVRVTPVEGDGDPRVTIFYVSPRGDEVDELWITLAASTGVHVGRQTPAEAVAS